MTGKRAQSGRGALLALYRRAVNLASLFILALIVGTAIYCISIRVKYEGSYLAAAIFAILACVVMVVAWGQQAIVARDIATWREMVHLQIAASRSRALQMAGSGETQDEYLAVLVDTLVRDLDASVEYGAVDDRAV